MSSATWTKNDASRAAKGSRAPRGGGSAGPEPSPEVPSSLWQVYVLLGMVAAAAAVWATQHTHPAALILLSAATLGAGFVALTIHRALAAFLGRGGEVVPPGERRREVLEKEKALVLRSIKELEFDRAMGKIGDADFAELESRLRARALTLMQDLERAAPAPRVEPAGTPAGPRHACAECGTLNEPDAKFCKQCGKAMDQT